VSDEASVDPMFLVMVGSEKDTLVYIIGILQGNGQTNVVDSNWKYLV
jgi:hypothetical protein